MGDGYGRNIYVSDKPEMLLKGDKSLLFSNTPRFASGRVKATTIMLRR